VAGNHGQLQIELEDGKGTPGLRLVFADSVLSAKAGARYKNFFHYKADSVYNIRITVNTTNRFYTVNINGKDELTSLMFAPLDAVERIVFRTGEPRHFPDADTPADQTYDLPKAAAENAVFHIRSIKTAAL
jgi:hypothetical protein